VRSIRGLLDKKTLGGGDEAIHQRSPFRPPPPPDVPSFGDQRAPYQFVTDTLHRDNQCADNESSNGELSI
jgi:hypothetical protein